MSEQCSTLDGKTIDTRMLESMVCGENGLMRGFVTKAEERGSRITVSRWTEILSSGFGDDSKTPVKETITFCVNGCAISCVVEYGKGKNHHSSEFIRLSQQVPSHVLDISEFSTKFSRAFWTTYKLVEEETKKGIGDEAERHRLEA